MHQLNYEKLDVTSKTPELLCAAVAQGYEDLKSIDGALFFNTHQERLGYIQELCDYTSKHARVVSDCAEKKGWWEKPRASQEILLLIASEFSEALEELRKNSDVNFLYNGLLEKPEGFRVEIADAIIRMMDVLGGVRNDTLSEDLFATALQFYVYLIAATRQTGMSTRVYDMLISSQLGVLSTQAPYDIVRCRKRLEDEEKQEVSLALKLTAVLGALFAYLAILDIDVLEQLKQKIAYNQQRAYKHNKLF